MKRYQNTATFYPPQLPDYDPDYMPHPVRAPAADPVVAKRRDTFVPAAPVQRTQIDVLPPSYEIPTIAPAALVESRTAGSYQDRARAFQIVSVPISLAFGFGACVVALVGFSVPFFSLPMLAVFWVAFLLWWLAAWWLHLQYSPDGVALIHTVRGWKYLEREQKARLQRYKEGRR